ncbi:arginine:agmatine antiporter [Sinobacterium caligoides]|uniref:Arginine/agmatine antiporter n=1 Tax=Sinobacterium caligoides TaxID=933926 RepID=A0A3N2E1D0_9GAMM|nr:amino acid permease [Sinobacterium caligoides]ROS05375.1 arginine:agmatine antiporter [Sinobacterium caligoides]
MNAKKIGLVALTLVAVSNMLGSGIFLVPTILAKIGSISIWSWIFTGVGTMCLAFVFTRLTILKPDSSGIIGQSGRCYGPYVEFMLSISYWVTCWVGNIALIITGVGYLAYFFPVLNDPVYRAIAASIMLWFFTLLALVGADFTSKLQSVTTVLLIGIVIALGVMGVYKYEPGTFSATYNMSGESSMHAIALGIAACFWSFLGLEGASVTGDLVENPERTIPIATIAGFVIAWVLCIIATYGIYAALPYDQLVSSSAPFADAARYVMGPSAGDFVAGASIVIIFFSLNGWLVLQSQPAKVAADKGLLPPIMGKVNKNQVPAINLIITAVLMTAIIFATISPTAAKQFEVLILLAVFTSIVPYIFAVSSLIVFRLQDGIKLLDMKLDIFSALVALIFCVYVMTTIEVEGLAYGLEFVVLTIPLYTYVLWRKNKDKGGKLEQQAG